MLTVAQRDVVWFYVTPAQRNVYLSVAARACLLNASSSSRAQTKRYTVNPPPEVELRRRQVEQLLVRPARDVRALSFTHGE